MVSWPFLAGMLIYLSFQTVQCWQLFLDNSSHKIRRTYAKALQSLVWITFELDHSCQTPYFHVGKNRNMAPSIKLKNALICAWFVLKITWVRAFSKRIIDLTVSSYKVATLRTQASKRGVGWGLGWPVPMRKLLVKFKPQLGLYHDCAFMLIYGQIIKKISTDGR